MMTPAPKRLKRVLPDIDANDFKEDSRLTMFSPNGSTDNFGIHMLKIPQE
jgi:hypothetical protein